MEFAIIETGGKQYKITPDLDLSVEKLSGDHKEGDKIVFDKVLLTSDGTKTVVGKPYIDGAKVEATFQTNDRQKKVSVVRYRSKSRYHKKKGHRQPVSKVTIAKV